jgi:mercuric reductase
MIGGRMGYDLAIVGSGSGAFAAAIEAVRKGKRVVMIERGVVGGTCVNVGCIPSKALLAAAEARHVAADARFPGIRTEAGPVDMAGLVGGKQELVDGLRHEKYLDLIDDYGWELVRGEGRFVEGPAVEVDGRRVEADHYVIATGSAPWAPPIDGLDDVGYLTSTTAMELDEAPGSVIVVGGNYVGLEQGQIFQRLGSEVTLLEALDRIAPAEEPEISATLADVLAEEGMAVHAGAEVTAVRRDGDEVVVTARVDGEGKEFRAEQLLVATGRRPATDRLDLPAVGVEVGRRGEVVVDDQLRTGNPRIWAVGDVTGHPQFVYVAGAHGAIAVDNAFDDAGRTVDYRTMPRVTFTSPNVAAVGITDAQAAEQGLDCTCRVLELKWVPRAIVNRDTRGAVKIVAERRSGIVRGVHVLADNAGDVILAGVYAVQAGMTVEQMANTWAPYLTMSEGLKLAAQTFTGDVSRLSCCAA